MLKKLLSCFALLICAFTASATSGNYHILKVQTFPNHIFTQGLDIYKNRLYFSSGLYGQSQIGYIENNKTKTKQLSKNLFLEGLVNHDDELYALTWKAGKLLVLEPNTLKLKGSVSYRGHGWGLTHDGACFIMSNGTNILQFRDSHRFQLLKTITVNYQGIPCYNLNSLAYAKGYIWANIWKSNHILKISAKSGNVVRTWDMSALVEKNRNENIEAVLNGLAYDKASDAFWITGKLWSKRYLVKFL